jgi:hypothetical protein
MSLGSSLDESTDLMEPSVNTTALLDSNYQHKTKRGGNYLGFTLSAGESTRKKLKPGVSSNHSIFGPSPRLSTKNETGL